MPVFDAVQDTRIELIHVRHEAAAVHMAEAWSRVTGQVGFALATGGQGHANGAAALFNARSSDSSLVYLSGHAGLKELGRGAFQEMAQAEMARPVTKASWTAQSAATLGHELARAIRIAASGRPGPVHLSLPIDVLEQELNLGPAGADSLNASFLPELAELQPTPTPLADELADLMLARLARARKPLILCGPALSNDIGREQMQRLESALLSPVIAVESPRGINDPSLGAFAEILAQADLILMIAKELDYSLRFGDPPFVSERCEFMVLHPELEAAAVVGRAKPGRLVCFGKADHDNAMKTLLARAKTAAPSSSWLDEVNSAIRYRPEQWQQARSKVEGALHAAEVCREINAFLGRQPRHTVIFDGGEFGQWAQSLVKPKRRLINGLAGSIGIGLPFAIATKAARPQETVIVMMGDGTFGFHLAEFETALRCGLPVIAVVGNDAYWNAEYQIQLRSYGKARAKGCELLPARYDKVVEALGGHGEYVTSSQQLAPALERALASGKPACINVRIEPVSAPIVRRAQSS
jgi:acetolactate synthase-1/2/3 large subunit